MSSKVYISGQPSQLFESLKNNELFYCPANPFLDAWFWLMDRYAPQAISVDIFNHLLFIDIDAFREKTHVLRTYPIRILSREWAASRAGCCMVWFSPTTILDYKLFSFNDMWHFQVKYFDRISPLIPFRSTAYNALYFNTLDVMEGKSNSCTDFGVQSWLKIGSKSAL